MKNISLNIYSNKAIGVYILLIVCLDLVMGFTTAHNGLTSKESAATLKNFFFSVLWNTKNLEEIFKKLLGNLLLKNLENFIIISCL